MDDSAEFKKEIEKRVLENSKNEKLLRLSSEFLYETVVNKYSYNFSWLGRPIIQYPQDMVAMQELIFSIQPDLIIETGIARGGSLIYYASLLELISIMGGSEGEIVGIDVDIREHNKVEIESHPMFKRITMIEGSSIDNNIVEKVKSYTNNKKRVMVLLDSNHTHEHALAELEAYAPLTSIDSYCVVFDTLIEDMPENTYPDRPWGHGNNPKTAVWEYLKNHPEFIIDKSVQNKLLVTVAPDGYLKRVS